jgi:hypothetical protein
VCCSGTIVGTLCPRTVFFGSPLMACERRFHGEPYGLASRRPWRRSSSSRGELLFSRGGFARRELAVRWAEIERQAIEGRPCAHCGGAGWMCEAHPDQLTDHDPACDGPAVACPRCQPQTSDDRPRMPSDWRSLLKDDPMRWAEEGLKAFEKKSP